LRRAAKIKDMGRVNAAVSIPRVRLLLLFGLFFCICCGLGYPSLNRVDWRKAPGGLEDVATYAALVTAPPVADANDHTQFRVLLPYMAKPLYRLVRNRIGTWDPVMFALLVVNAFFVALTAMVLVVVVNREMGSYAIALGSALIYLLNFAVPNLRLVGMIDAGEACFLMLVVWTLAEERYWMLPMWAVLGAMAKESFVPFLIVFTAAWWLGSRGRVARTRGAAGWIAASWFAAVAAIVAVQWKVTGAYQSPIQFGIGLHGNSAYASHLVASLRDRNLWYIFFWLLPLSVFRLRRFSLRWRVATVAGCVAAFVMDAYYGGPPGAIGRALFTVAGPLLSASVAALLFTGVDRATDGSEPHDPAAA
jgi:hypothetical protein